MSYFECPDCGKKHSVFGESHIDDVAAGYGIDTICRLPVNSKVAAGADAGLIELFEGPWLDDLSDKIENL